MRSCLNCMGSQVYCGKIEGAIRDPEELVPGKTYISTNLVVMCAQDGGLCRNTWNERFTVTAVGEEKVFFTYGSDGRAGDAYLADLGVIPYENGNYNEANYVVHTLEMEDDEIKEGIFALETFSNEKFVDNASEASVVFMCVGCCNVEVEAEGGLCIDCMAEYMS